MSLNITCDCGCDQPIPLDEAIAVQVERLIPAGTPRTYHVLAAHLEQLTLEAPAPPDVARPHVRVTRAEVGGDEETIAEYEASPGGDHVAEDGTVEPAPPLDQHFDDRGQLRNTNADEHAILQRMGPAAMRELAERRAKHAEHGVGQAGTP